MSGIELSVPTFEEGLVAGVKAFAAGKPAAPALDDTVRAVLRPLGVGAGTAYVEGWLQGWHAGNIAALIDTGPGPDGAEG